MHPSLPPLPLIDGCLFVDNSMLELLTTCPRALQYNRFHQRVAAVSKPSLAFGSAIHLALEHRYKNYNVHPPDVALEMEQSELLTKFFDENPQPEGDFRNLNWAFEMIKRYNKAYDLEPFQLLMGTDGKPMVELSFALPLYTSKVHFEQDNLWEKRDVPVIYTGRIDLPVIWDGQLFIGDHKTTSMIGPSFFDKMKMSAQQKGYAWAFQTLTGQKVTGYFINAIRVKEPPLSLGVEGGRTKTTVAAWWRESFQRERYMLQPGELDEWKSNTILLIEEMFYHYQKGTMPQKTVWCDTELPAAETGFPMNAGAACARYGRCQYFDVCSLPAEDREVALASGWFMDNTWNPLRQPTQAKQ